jgi:hypothetical protein
MIERVYYSFFNLINFTGGSNEPKEKEKPELFEGDPPLE